jgi:hypothetical protein
MAVPVAIAMGDRNPVGHHVTNIILTEVDGQVVRVSAPPSAPR